MADVEVLLDPRCVQVAQKGDPDCVFWNARQTWIPADQEDLMEKIRTLGLITPPSVREYRGHHQLICGERRLRCVLRLLETRADCFDRRSDEFRDAEEVYGKLLFGFFKDCSDLRAAEISFMENFGRTEPSEIDLMNYCIDLENRGLSREEICGIVRRSAGWVSQTINLYKLSPRVQDLLARGMLLRSDAIACLAYRPETVDTICEQTERRAKLAHQKELMQIGAEIERTSDELQVVEIQKQSAIEDNCDAKPLGRVNRASEALKKKLDKLKNKDKSIRESSPRITSGMLDEVADELPDARKAKRSVVSHKSIRAMREKLQFELSHQAIKHPDFPKCVYNKLDVELIVDVFSFLLGELDTRSPLEVLQDIYIRRQLPHWKDVERKNSRAEE